MICMNKRVRGSVSILLCLILMPMITYSTMIIDASRLQAVRSNISGAGDNVLNAILSDYNISLEEMYGLFANTNLVADDKGNMPLQDVLKAYFQQTIEGRFVPQVGKNGEYIQNTINGLVDRGFGTTLSEEDMTDFLRTQLDTFTADPVAGSALANPNTMKRQIIEYMKYRGPVSIASTLLGKLDYLADSTSQVDACEKKVEYTEKLGELQDPCQQAYDAIESKYNVGALLMNELRGQGITKKTTDNFNTMLTNAQNNLNFSTSFYLLYAQSPFYDTEDIKVKIVDKEETYSNYDSKQNNFLSHVTVPDYSFTMHFPENPNDSNLPNRSAYVSVSVDTNRNNRITENLHALKSIIEEANSSCGFKAGENVDNKSLEIMFDDILSEVKERDNGNRTIKNLNKYCRTKVDRTPNDKYKYTDPNTGREHLYPSYNDLKQDNLNSDLYKPLRPYFYGGDGTNKNDVNKDAKILANGNTFNTQMDQAIEVLKAQKLLCGPMREGIMDLAEHHKKMQALKGAYQQIWDQLEKDIQARYEDERNEARGEAETEAKTKTKENKEKWYYEHNDEGSREWTFTAWEEREEFKDWKKGWLEDHDDEDPGFDDYWYPDDLTVKPVYPDDTKIWNDLCKTLNEDGELLDLAESNLHGLNGIMIGLDEYNKEINFYIDRVTHYNDTYFLKYAHAYDENAYSPLLGAGATLKIMSDGLKKAGESLDTILGLIDGDGTDANPGLQKLQDEWGKSVNGINSDSTKAAMTSDFNTLKDQINRKEVQDLKDLVTELKTKTDNMISDLEGITYLDKPLLKFGSGKELETVISEEGKRKQDGQLGKVEASFASYYNAGDSNDPEKIVKTATENMYGMVSQSKALVSLPSYDKHSTIKETTVEELDRTKVCDIAKKLVNDHHKTDSLYKGGDTDHPKYKDEIAKIFQILDGIKDEKGCVISKADKSKAGLNSLKGEHKEFLDEKEAFMITLYTEAKAADEAEKHKEEEKSKPEGKGKEDHMTEGAQEQINEADKKPEDKRDKSKLAQEDFPEIMGKIESYCDQNVKNEIEQAPKMQTATIKKGKEAGKSKGGNALKDAKKTLAKIANIGQEVVNNVYLEEYFTEMFTCRTDNQMLNSLTADPDKKVLPVIMMNGYGNSATKDMGCKKFLNEETEWYGKEIEYLLWGSSSYEDGKLDIDNNLLYTDAMIFAIRFALNAIYAFTAPDIQSYALELATAIAGWTVVGVPIVQVCITILIALAESGYDLYLLHDGRNVPIYKNQATFVCSPTGMLKAIAGEVKDKVLKDVVPGFMNKVEEELDKAIEGAADKIAGTAKQRLEAWGSTVEEFGKQQAESIKSAIKKQFVTPLINQIIPLASLTEISEQYASANTDDLINDAVSKAMTVVKDNIDHNMQGGIVQTICKKLFDSQRANIEKVASEKIKEYLDSLKLDDVTKHLNIEEKLDEYLNEMIDPFVKEIDSSVEGVKKDLMKQITDAKDLTVDNAKSFVSEKMDQATAQLTGKLEEGADKILNNIPDGKEIDTDASSGVTLNYKEYCKIFMLLAVSVNQDAVLQRAAVLITANMRNPAPGKKESFDIWKANTVFSVNAQVDMVTLFPWPVKDVQNDASPESGIQLDLSSIRSQQVVINYCGINGY